MKSFVLIFSICVFPLFLTAQNGTKIIKDVNVIDVKTGKSKQASVLIKDKKIVKIARSIKEDAAQVIEGSGKYLIPGLVDAHIHLFQSGGLYTRPDVINLQKHHSYEKERDWLKENADAILKRYLRSGITTVIDVGGPMYQFEIRDRLKDSLGFPNLYMTGPLISTYQPQEFNLEDAPIIKVDNSEEARSLVRKQIPFNPDFIKIWYITLPSRSAESSYDIVKATIEESHKNNLPVAVHATELNTAKLAIKAGADILVHSVAAPIDEDFKKMLLKNDIVYIPTLIVHGKYSQVLAQTYTPTEYDFSLADPIPVGSLSDYKHLNDPIFDDYKQYGETWIKEDAVADEIRSKNLASLNSSGAIISTGTDAGNIGTHHVSSYFEELERMQSSGMSAADILKASTYHGAKVLSKEDELGSVEEGKLADLILLSENPLENIMAVLNPELIIKSGAVLKPELIFQESPEGLAQQQLNAYNHLNLEHFLTPYSDSVNIRAFPGDLLYTGKENMVKTYGQMFEQLPKLHAELKNRMTIGNVVIDEEWVTGIDGYDGIKAIVIYTIENNKIIEVQFLQQ